MVAPHAKPIFQIGGSGAVGTGSLRGFPLLRRLLTGPVVKSRAPAREAYLRSRDWPMAAAVTEDAFDAAVSALVMDRHRAALGALPVETDPVLRREGVIWAPAAHVSPASCAACARG
jgi:hypothetical protein